MRHFTPFNSDLHKLDEWQTLVEPDNMEWFETDSEDDDEDEDDDDEDEQEGLMDAENAELVNEYGE